MHYSDDDHTLVFSKQAGAGEERDTVVVVINLDPHAARETMVHLDLAALGLPESFVVHDEISGQDWTWGRDNYVRLDPGRESEHILTVRSL